MAADTDDMTSQVLEARAVRYADLVPCLNAFVDSRTPGSDSKENFTIIGPGVSENPNQHVHLPESHGFNIGGARQPPGCLNSQHSHLTAEVFIVHSGEWVFRYGVNADDGEVRLSPGDTISIPTHMFRGFENIGSEPGFLFAILGGDDPGRVTWAPRVFELAGRYGLVLLAGGKLVDTTVGETVAADAVHEKPPDADELGALRTPAAHRLAGCVAPAGAVGNAARSRWSTAGIAAHRVIDDDPAAGATIRSWWPHGFSLHRLCIDAEAISARHAIDAPTVIWVLEGALQVQVGDDSIGLGSGDTFSAPPGSSVALHNPDARDAVVFVVEGQPVSRR